MKKLILFIALLIVPCINSFGQSLRHPIHMKDINQHVNDSVRIGAWVKNIKRLKGKKTQLIVWDKFGGKEEVYVIVRKAIMEKFKNFDIKKIKTQYVCIDGVIISIDGNYYIYITNPAQFENVSEMDFITSFK